MAKYLFIVESPNKVHCIQPILGKDYTVIASVGHIRDLPPKDLGVDIKNNFKPTYETMKGKEDIVKQIIFLAKKSDLVYIATDGDTEGHGIAEHIRSILPKGTKTKRVKYNEITKTAILKGLSNCNDLNDDIPIFDAYETRRIFDRIIGWKCSYGVKLATGGVSCGRVQSVGLRVLAELEKEIRAFIPVIYYPITAEVLTDKKEKIITSIDKPKAIDIKTEEDAKKIISIIKKGPVKVYEYKKTESEANPNPPFTTSTLLQAASSYLGFSVAKTTQLAQDLFTKSHITYIRSDSVVISDDAMKEIRTYIDNSYDKKYKTSSPVIYKDKGKNIEAGHECIRCCNVSLLNPPGLSSDEQKLYSLIWKRTVASQMTPAKYLRSSAKFSCDKYVLSANGSKELFDGFRKVWAYSDVNDQYLPELKVGEVVDIIDIKTEKKETLPPGHYSEASFIKELEKRGIGRPSTYKSIVQTLEDRGYSEKKGKSLQATDLGIKVSDYLISCNVSFIDIDFTCKMEDELDEIANKKLTKLEVLNKFWERLQIDLKNMKNTKSEVIKTEHKCPDCAKNKIEAYLVKKQSKYGEFLSCENCSNKEIKCKYTANLNKDGTIKEKGEVKASEESKFDCPNCGEKLLIRTSKKGKQYLGCKNWQDKDCKGFYKIENGEKMEFSNKKFGKKGYNKKKKDEEED